MVPKDLSQNIFRVLTVARKLSCEQSLIRSKHGVSAIMRTMNWGRNSCEKNTEDKKKGTEPIWKSVSAMEVCSSILTLKKKENFHIIQDNSISTY